MWVCLFLTLKVSGPHVGLPLPHAQGETARGAGGGVAGASVVVHAGRGAAAAVAGGGRRRLRLIVEPSRTPARHVPQVPGAIPLAIVLTTFCGIGITPGMFGSKAVTDLSNWEQPGGPKNWLPSEPLPGGHF